MATLRTSAQEYISPTTKNICELKSVNTEMDIKHKVVNAGTDKEFEYDFIVVNKEEYRVPASVLKQLKIQLEAKPSSVKFKVVKKGEGKFNTEYTVIMLD